MACVRSLPMTDRARAMRHARYVGPAVKKRFWVFVWFGLVRVGWSVWGGILGGILGGIARAGFSLRERSLPDPLNY